MRSVETVLFLVIVATLVATFANRLRIPAPSLLVVAGLIVGLIPGTPDIRIAPETVSLFVLPPLLYAAGEEMSWRDLRRVWRPVTVLAIGLVLASAAVVGVVATAVAPLPASMAFVLGAVLASTDPVAVTALGRRLSLPPRIQTLVQAESLFNDATSLVLFRVAIGVAIAGGAVSAGHAAGQFALLGGGGALVGVVVAAGILLIRKRTRDPVLETVIALVTPYTAYVLAESVHTSGVTAVIVASVVIGAQSERVTTAGQRLQLTAVYQTVIFLLESVVFALIGLQLPTLIRALAGSGINWFVPGLILTGTLLVVRILWVFPLSALRAWRHDKRRPSWQAPAVISWAGARGVVPLAAALSIPLVTNSGAPLAQRDLVLVLATMVIVVTLVVQGFTLAPLVRASGLAVESATSAAEQSNARLALAKASLSHLDEVADLEGAPEVVVTRLRHSLMARIDRLQQRVTAEEPVLSTAQAFRRLRRELISVETTELNRLYHLGEISDSTRRLVQRSLDLEDASLGED